MLFIIGSYLILFKHVNTQLHDIIKLTYKVCENHDYIVQVYFLFFCNLCKNVTMKFLSIDLS